MAEFRIDLKESIRIKKEFTAMIAEMKSLEKRLYAVKDNLSSMSEYKDIVSQLNRQCQEVTEERKDVEKLLQTFSECVKCYENAEKKVKEQEIDWHSVLDAAGLIPAVGAVFDGVNTAWYAAEGDWSNALLSGLAFAPGIGEAVGGGKTAVKAGGKVIGHIDDVADIAKAADKVEDAAKAAEKAGKAGRNAGEIRKYVDEAVEGGIINGFSKDINAGKQGKHMLGNNNYIEGRSVFYGTVDEAQKMVDEFAGTGEWIEPNKERVNFGKVIGKYVNPSTGESIDTTVGLIHYSKTGAHIVPAQPIE